MPAVFLATWIIRGRASATVASARSWRRQMCPAGDLRLVDDCASWGFCLEERVRLLG